MRSAALTQFQGRAVWFSLIGLTAVLVISAGVYLARAPGGGISPSLVGVREAQVPGLSGHVLSLSDVATIPNVPLPNVLVFAVPADQFAALLADEGLPSDAAEFPSRLGQLNLSRQSWDTYVSSTGSSDTSGEYHLELPPGAYLVCIANLSDRDPTRLPASVAGCAPIDVGTSTRTDLLWGLPGLVLG